MFLFGGVTYHQNAALVQHQLILWLLDVHHGLVLGILGVDRARHCGIGDGEFGRDACRLDCERSALRLVGEVADWL